MECLHTNFLQIHTLENCVDYLFVFFATPVDYPTMDVFDGTDFCNFAIQRMILHHASIDINASQLAPAYWQKTYLKGRNNRQDR